MKVAKVSSVYEGKIVNRGVGGEEGGEAHRSRMARQDAQARRRNARISLGPYSRVRSRPTKQRNIIIRSMVSNSLDKEKEKEMEKENQDVNEVKEQEKGKERVEEVIVVDEKEEKEEKTETETVTADAVPTGPVGDWMFVGTDDWPLTWSYAEEWLWGERA